MVVHVMGGREPFFVVPESLRGLLRSCVGRQEEGSGLSVLQSHQNGLADALPTGARFSRRARPLLGADVQGAVAAEVAGGPVHAGWCEPLPAKPLYHAVLPLGGEVPRRPLVREVRAVVRRARRRRVVNAAHGVGDGHALGRLELRDQMQERSNAPALAVEQLDDRVACLLGPARETEGRRGRRARDPLDLERERRRALPAPLIVGEGTQSRAGKVMRG